MTSVRRNPWRIASRVLASTLGAYFATAGVSALLAVLLVLWGGAERADALIAASMIGYVLFAVLMLWAFAERRLGRVWLVLIAAAVATHILAMWIEPSLPVMAASA